MLELYNKIFPKNSNWILEIDSWKAWKIIWISACTHWNERAWLYVMDYLLNTLDIKKRLKKWKLIFIAGNIKAIEKDIRFIDVDFNRIWWFEEKYKNTYEYKRALEIKPFLDKLDILLDIHSTSLDSDPFFITTSDYIEKDFLKYIKADYSIENIVWFLNWKVLSWYMWEQKKWNFSFVIEAWSHHSQKTIDLSILNSLNLLKYFWYLDWELEEQKEYKTYIVKECIKAKSMDIKFLYSDNPKSFDKIKVWEEIMLNWEEKVISDINWYTLMPSYPKYIWDEICYLMEKK